MTKRKYTQAPRLSRAPRPSASKSRRQSRRGSRSHNQRPYPQHFAAIEGGERHPIDDVIDRIPQIAKVDSEMRRLAEYWQDQTSNQRAFIHYEDLRLGQCILRQEAYFDAGYEHGRLAGRAESLAVSVSTPANWDLARKVELAAISADLPRETVVALLLEIARGLVLGPIFVRKRSTTARRPAGA